jgi:inner membrane protein
MDPITHGLAGTTIYNLGFKRKAAFWVLLLSSIAPDFDFITRLWGADVFLRYHRGISHGILALFVVPIIIGIIFGYRKGFFYYTFLAFIGYSIHLFMDLTNQYGTRILSPLDWYQYSLDLVFIFDPYITLGLLLSVILCKFYKKKAVTIALATVFLFVAYTGSRNYLHDKTKEFLRERMDANTYMVCPLPNDFLRWWFIAKSGDEIKVGFADLFTQRICMQETYTLNDRDPFINLSKKTRVVNNFLYFARYPYAEVNRNAENITVIWRELSYSFLPGDHFVAEVIFGSDGKVINSYFKF